jgi:flagellar transcriptional activator FlhD
MASQYTYQGKFKRPETGAKGMETEHMMEEIREINLRYMLLAQRMLREDKASASYRLGLGREVADILCELTPGQVLKMAGSGVLLPRFRFDDRLILDMLANYRGERTMTNTHAAILMAGLPAATIA